MKKLFKLSLLILFIIGFSNIQAQKKYSYETVPNDPLNARIYKLDNGLKVYMTVYKNAPRIQTEIAVKTGSKNDPHDNTGLSHYLEHMMFKGTESFGSKDYKKEVVELNKIDSLFEVYRSLKDSVQRIKLYHVIDSVSGVASKLAIANEYDKMLSVIGAKGTNAYTSVEQTVYINDIPSNQVENWLTIEAERFSHPVFRLFHTELEAVYEEKNMGLDSDGDKAWEALYEGVFQKHTYGTQTTIGTIEHLKNPSLKALKNYYNTKYVPNNMCISLSGDFDPDVVIKQIDEKFGQLKYKEVSAYVPPVEDPILKPIVKEVVGPDAENVMLAFRLGGASTKDAEILEIMDKILSNSTAGLFDLNLNQAQKVLSAGSYADVMKDYSVHILYGNAKEGQKLEEVKDLVLEQLELVKKGEFPDWLIPAIINEFKLDEIKSSENNRSRAAAMVSAFVNETPWSEEVSRINRLAAITKKDIVDFANKNYTKDNYVVVYKRTGEDLNVKKVVKPQLTPVSVNREDQSEFLKKILNSKTPDIEPVFLDYEKDIKKLTAKSSLPVLYKENVENKTFDLYYVFDMGTNHNKKIKLAVDYLSYLGTSKLTPAQVQQELYKAGCSFNVFSSGDQTWVSLRGLSENLTKGLAIFEALLADAQPNPDALKNLVSDVLKTRADDKLSKDVIKTAMYNYGAYGTKSPFRDIISEKDLNDIKPEELTSIIKSLNTFQHRVLYYGSHSADELIGALDKYHNIPATLHPIPVETQYVELENNENNVYIVNYDMKQVELMMLSKSEKFNKVNVPSIKLFNEYFGGGMSSIVFQELRESKALAYTAYAIYRSPSRLDKCNYIYSYIGTQIDKLPEAMKGMSDLINNMPESEKNFSAAKEAVIKNIRTERVTRASILFNYENAKKLGLNYDIRKDIFNKIPNMQFSDLKTFQEKYLKNKKYSVLVLGNKKNLDIKTLEKYGKINYLTLEDIFGY
ncbi:MAG: insulinase family protein [Bacteroidetes bacterium]|nr:insulinase family protein [Bacteroidota bacterium]